MLQSINYAISKEIKKGRKYPLLCVVCIFFQTKGNNCVLYTDALEIIIQTFIHN